jgi:hypothetical protein
MSENDKLKLCGGCHNNFYNGNNPYGINRCWSLASAEPARRKFVHLDDVPPWEHQPVEDTLSCHRRRGYVSVAPEVIC